MALSPEIKRVIHNGKPRFLIDIRSVNRGRLFFKSAQEAERQLGDIQDNGVTAAQMPVADRLDAMEAKKILEGSGATLRQAAEFFVANCSFKGNKNLSEAAEIFERTKASTGKRHRYVQQLSIDLRNFRLAIGDKECHEITAQTIHDWLHGQQWKVATIRAKFINIQTFFSFCLKQGWVLKNPCATIERVRVDEQVPGILTVEQCEKLLRSAQVDEPSRRMIPYIALALFAGVRPQEIFRLKWGNVDLEAGLLRIEGAVDKNRRRRIVSLSANCVAWLRTPGGKLPPVHWQKLLNRIRERAGVPWPHDCLRHSYCSYSLPIHHAGHTALQAGHSEQILFRHYREMVTRSEAELFWKIYPMDRQKSPE